MNNLKKMIGICLIIVFIIVGISTNVLGFSYNEFKPNTNNTTNISGVGNTIISIIRILGMILSVGVLMVLGIKYMMGSAEEKAEYKKTMIPYVIGAVLIFASTFIVNAVYQFASGI